jgi:hypothetical protein
MEVLQQLKKLYVEKFEDNFYLFLGLFFVLIYQLLIILFNIFKRLFNFIMVVISDYLKNLKGKKLK